MKMLISLLEPTSGQSQGARTAHRCERYQYRVNVSAICLRTSPYMKNLASVPAWLCAKLYQLSNQSEAVEESLEKFRLKNMLMNCLPALLGSLRRAYS